MGIFKNFFFFDRYLYIGVNNNAKMDVGINISVLGHCIGVM